MKKQTTKRGKEHRSHLAFTSKPWPCLLPAPSCRPAQLHQRQPGHGPAAWRRRLTSAAPASAAHGAGVPRPCPEPRHVSKTPWQQHPHHPALRHQGCWKVPGRLHAGRCGTGGRQQGTGLQNNIAGHRSKDIKSAAMTAYLFAQAQLLLRTLRASWLLQRNGWSTTVASILSSHLNCKATGCPRNIKDLQLCLAPLCDHVVKGLVGGFAPRHIKPTDSLRGMEESQFKGHPCSTTPGWRLGLTRGRPCSCQLHLMIQLMVQSPGWIAQLLQHHTTT